MFKNVYDAEELMILMSSCQTGAYFLPLRESCRKGVCKPSRNQLFWSTEGCSRHTISLGFFLGLLR